MPRFVHANVSTKDPRFKQASDQLEISTERYHYLVAAITKQYKVFRNAEDALYPYGLDFSLYKDFKLDNVPGTRFRSSDGVHIDEGHIRSYLKEFADNWKTREGGVLYCIAEWREFWSCILHYHSSAASTCNLTWDALFAELKANGFQKETIPCMWFAREAGCLHAACPYLHDKVATEADRVAVLAKRRAYLSRPIPRLTSKYEQRRARELEEWFGRALTTQDLNTLAAEVESLTGICWTFECTKANRGSDPEPLKSCSRCKVATYCSTRCQKADWKNHKPDCRPLPEIIEDDERWSQSGTKIGTEALDMDWKNGRGTFIRF